jgi:hypothetical protein
MSNNINNDYIFALSLTISKANIIIINEIRIMKTLLSRIFDELDREDYEASRVEASEKGEADKAYQAELLFIQTACEDAVCLTYNVGTREEALQYAKEMYQFENQ